MLIFFFQGGPPSSGGFLLQCCFGLLNSAKVVHGQAGPEGPTCAVPVPPVGAPPGLSKPSCPAGGADDGQDNGEEKKPWKGALAKFPVSALRS